MRRPHALLLTLCMFACGQSVSCGGCMGVTPLPGPFTGVRADSAAAARLTASGFDVLNINAPLLLQAIAPGGNLDIPLSCSVQNASLLGQLVMADEGAVACTSETCGQLDGKCMTTGPTADVPKTISVHFNTFHLQPKSPDLIEAVANITLTTNGKIMMSSPQNHLLCGFSSPDQLKLSVDLDTGRVAPPDVEIKAGIRFTVDMRWWKLLSFEVQSLAGTSACSGSVSPPGCIDSQDMVIRAENSCSGWLGTLGNIDLVKDLILGQLTKTLQDRIQEALAETNCRQCDALGMCPANGVATSFCRADDGGTPDAGFDCFDPIADHCVPGVLGVENRIDVQRLLGASGASALDVSIAAGGATTANDAGFTLGFTGGALETQTATCVKPLTEPMPPMLPLPDFDREAPRAYDLGISVSQQMMSRLLLHAQQSGALCLELGNDSVSLLDSSLVGTLLPSLNKLTHGDVVPMRVVVRPTNAPTATFGSGMPNEPQITLNWNDAQVDVYALLEDRYARVFSVSFDLALPLSLSIEGCATITPVIGDLKNAISDVHGLNSEMLAEPLTALEGLVPALISFAEPALSGGIMGFTLPAFGDFQVRLLSIQGLGNISGTRAYNHLGVYAGLLPATDICVAMQMRVAEVRLKKLKQQHGLAELDVTSRDQEYSWRVPGGLWSTWHKPNSLGILEVTHPQLMLDGRHVIELRTRDDAHDPSPSISIVLDRNDAMR